jgi:hypothetical protein
VSFRQKLMNEIKELAVAGLYFAAWLGVLVVLKKLILDQYQIEFNGLSVALVGALVLAKVVLILEHAPLGKWIRNHNAWVDVVLRTILYSAGVLIVLLLEKAFEGRHEHGGFLPSLMSVFQDADGDDVWANTICLSGALFGYNVLSVIRRHLGEVGLKRLFLSPLPNDRSLTAS